jgi:hypothetical protein
LPWSRATWAAVFALSSACLVDKVLRARHQTDWLRARRRSLGGRPFDAT